MEPKYIRFERIASPKRRKTKVWRVVAKSSEFLGIVQWFSPWRRYAFEPCDRTVFERQCLLDIAEFIEEQTRLHRQAARDLAKSEARSNDSENHRSV